MKCFDNQNWEKELEDVEDNYTQEMCPWHLTHQLIPEQKKMVSEMKTSP